MHKVHPSNKPQPHRTETSQQQAHRSAHITGCCHACAEHAGINQILAAEGACVLTPPPSAVCVRRSASQIKHAGTGAGEMHTVQPFLLHHHPQPTPRIGEAIGFALGTPQNSGAPSPSPASATAGDAAHTVLQSNPSCCLPHRRSPLEARAARVSQASPQLLQHSNNIPTYNPTTQVNPTKHSQPASAPAHIAETDS